MNAARSTSGFVLVLVLGMLVVLSLLAGAVATVTARLLEQSQGRAQSMQDAIDMASTRSTVLYLLNTQRMTIGGLTVDNLVSSDGGGVRRIASDGDLGSSLPIGTEIALDGRPYRGFGGVRFSLQDDFGLLGVNWSSPLMLDRLLAQGGPKNREVPAETLINRLLDYQDKDSMYRLNSAEADGYRKLGMAPPTNMPLATPMELLRVMGWRQALSFMAPPEIQDTLSVDTGLMINVNTAPARVLRLIQGMDTEKAARVIAYRKLQPFLTETAFFEFAGLLTSSEAPIAVYPAMSGTLKLWPSQGGQVVLVHWMMTPFENKGRPWREDYELIQSKAPSVEGVAYPVRSRLFARQVAPRP